MDIPHVTREVRKALAKMQRGKATGEDQVTADLLKVGVEIVLEKLLPLCTRWLKKLSVPDSWRNGNIVLII